jgi:RNA polymerase sigma-70 factor (ECF subfamily)
MLTAANYTNQNTNELSNEELDQLIIQIAENKDERAFRRLFDLFYPGMLHLSYHYVKSYTLAQDAVSEVFIILWNNRKELTRIKNFRTYIFVLTKNKSIDMTRNHWIKKRGQFPEDIFMVNTTNSHPEKIFIYQEISRKVKQIIYRMPARCRLVYVLIKQQGLKYKETATILNVSVKAIEKQMGKAMKMLKNGLEEYENDYL